MKVRKQSRRAAKRLFRVCQVDGVLDEARVRQVAQGLAEGGHRDRLAILTHFRHLLKLDRSGRVAIIESATPLPADMQALLKESLAQRYGAALTAEFSERPELIGGVRVQVGCDVYDGSIRAKLQELARSF